MKHWNDRLREACEAAGVRNADLARACGVATSSVSQWFTGRTKNMRPENLFAACDYIGASPRFIATGKQRPGADGRFAAFDTDLWLDCEQAVSAYVRDLGLDVPRREQLSLVATLYDQSVANGVAAIQPEVLRIALTALGRARVVSGEGKAPQRGIESEAARARDRS